MLGITGVGPAVVVRVTANTQQAQQAFQALQGQLSSMGQHFSAIEGHMRSLDHTMRYIAAFAIGSVVKETVNLIAEMERLNTLLIVSEGTFERVARRMDQLITLTSRMPFSLQSVTKAFQQMNAAGIRDLVDENGNGVLKNLLNAIAAFGGSEESLKLAALALTQIQGKGVVNLEELKRQLGEQIPTAVRDMAAGMGISISELFGRISKNLVTAEEGIRALSQTWAVSFKDAGEMMSNTFLGSIQQVKGAFANLANTFAVGGALDPFSVLIKRLASEINDLAKAFTAGDVQTAMQNFFSYISSNSTYLGQAAAAIQSIGVAISSLFTLLGTLLSALPAESIGFGFVGYILFGAGGAAIGAMMGQSHELFASIIQGITSVGQFFISTMAGFGGDFQNTVSYGAIGWFLMGTAGLIGGGIIGFVNDLFNKVTEKAKSLATNIAGLVGALDSALSTSTWLNYFTGRSMATNATPMIDAFNKAYEQFKSRNITGPDDPISGSGLRITGVGDAAAVAARKIQDFGNSMKIALAEFGAARRAFEDSFSKVNPLEGPTTKQIEMIEKFTKAQQQAQEALLRNTKGAGAAYREHMGVIAKDMQSTIDQMIAQRDKLLSEGAPPQRLIILNREIDTGTTKLETFKKTVEAAAAAMDAKMGGGSPILQKYAAQIDLLNSKFDTLREQFSGGKLGNVDLQVAKAAQQFQVFRTEIEKMIISVEKARKVEGDRTGTLAALNAMLERTNELQKEAEAIMRRKAQREIEDMTRSSNRSVEDYATQLQAAQLALQPFSSMQVQVNSDMASARSAYRGVTDELRNLQRQLEDLGTDPKNQGLRDVLQGDIDKLKELQQGFQKLFEMTKNGQFQLAKLSKTFWDSVGDSIERGLGDTLTAIVMRTGKVKDALISMYTDITKAAINYLVKFALVQSGLSANGTFSGMFGSGGGLGSMFGGIASWLGLGGGGGSAASALSWDGGASMMAWGMGVPFANGAAFNRGIKYFAGGDILTGPVAFPMGVAGEAGPEAIMPLERRNGKLGVRASGGGNNYTISIQALDGPSVRELFMKEGSSLIAAMQGRDRLNRGYRQNW